MSQTVTPSQLRQDIYRLIDRVLESGEPLEIERKGRRLRLVPADSMDRLSRIRTHSGVIVGDPDDLDAIDWSATWDADRAVNP
jgi:antitoxin (DNA-binding transcriptional repressor) of toxin-antitoxin stability system